MPDLGAVITVIDPAKSEALWTLALGLAGLASGSPAVEGDPVQIEGATVRRYKFPEGVTIYFATHGNDVLIATTKSAMAGSIRAKNDGRSITKDEAYAASLSRVGPDTTKAVLVHAGRCAKIAKQFMPPRDLEEAAPFMAMLSETTASFLVEHSGEMFRVSAMVTGIPDIGDLVSAKITQEARRHQTDTRLTKAIRSQQWDDALATVDEQLQENPESIKLLKAKFEILAGQKDRDAAVAVAKTAFTVAKDDAKALNNLAWALLTEKKFGDAYADVALKFSKRSNEITEHDNWMFVDTLALALFKTGNVEEAVKVGKKAIELCGGCGGGDGLKEALAKFEAGATSGPKTAAAGTE
jgi:hypothetical protein